MSTVKIKGDTVLTDSIINKSITEINDDICGNVGKRAFINCAALEKADFSYAQRIKEEAFRGCSSLNALILRKNSVCTFENNALADTPIANGDGYIYVPTEKVDATKGNCVYPDKVRAIEDYPEVCSRLGKVWKQSNITDQRAYSVAYGNGLWQSNKYYSADGKTWKTRSQTYDFRNFLYANGMWVARSTSVYYSEDGETWTFGGVSGLGSYFDIAYGNGVWVTASMSKGVYYSEDGKTWTQGNITSTQPVKCIAYGNGLWVVSMDEYGSLWLSADGKTWTKKSISSVGYVYSAVYANGMWLLATDRGVYYSEDGSTWIRSNATTQLYWVGYSNGMFFAGDSGLKYSTDGKTWMSSNVTLGAYRVIYADGVWVAYSSGNNGMYYSKDGKTWVQSDYPTTSRSDSICYANGVLAVASQDTIGLWYSKP